MLLEVNILKILKTIKRYIQIYLILSKNSIIAQMEYRANFVTALLVECAFLLAKSLYAIVVYNANITINGLTPDDILLFIGNYTILTGIMCGIFYMNFTNISNFVREGTLDILITKPVSLQFLIAFKTVNIGLAIPNIIGGTLMVIIAINRIGMDITFTLMFWYIVLMIVSIVITYGILLIPSLLSFWIVKNQAINDMTYALWDFNNMPMGIYSKWLQRFGVFVVPIFIISNFPSLLLIGKISTMFIIWSVIVSILLIVLSSYIWKRALNGYSSASS
jgi:ABC-2 type transport system permease protein